VLLEILVHVEETGIDHGLERRPCNDEP